MQEKANASAVKFHKDTAFHGGHKKQIDPTLTSRQSSPTKRSKAEIVSSDILSEEQPPSQYSKGTLKIAKSAIYDNEDDKHDALQFNSRDLPFDYLVARLSFTKEEAEHYRRQRKTKELKEDERRNTGFHFAKPDLYTRSQSSFNEMFQSEKAQPPEIVEGLEHIVQDFQNRSEFMQAMKISNKLATKQESQKREMFSVFVEAASNYGNIPLPLLLKIKKGILYVPQMYTITEGVANAMKLSLERLSARGENNLVRAILQNNKMNDHTFSMIMEGFLMRQEFQSLQSSMNYIGHKSADFICKMLDRNYGEMPPPNLDLGGILDEDEDNADPKKPGAEATPQPVVVAKPIPHVMKYGKQVPQIQELRL